MENLFLRALTEDPRDDAARGAYADWLEEQGLGTVQAKAQAMFLRTTAALAALAEDQASERVALAERPRKVATRLSTEWLAAVARAPIEGCPMKRAMLAGPHPPTSLQCDNRWEDLRAPFQPAWAERADSNCYRYCSMCSQSVRFCGNIDMAHDQSLAGYAVVVSPAVRRWEGDLNPEVQRIHFVGEFSPESERTPLPPPRRPARRRRAQGSHTRPLTRRRRKRNAV